MALVALIGFAFLHLITPMINEALDSSSEKTEQYITVDNVKYRIVNSFEQEKSSVAEKDSEQVYMSFVVGFYRQAVAADGIKSFIVIDRFVKFVANGFKISYEGLNATIVEHLDNYRNSEYRKLYKVTELSKERTDLINFEYKILGATKKENKEHILDLEHYIFLRLLDLEELNNNKIKAINGRMQYKNERITQIMEAPLFSAYKKQAFKEFNEYNSYNMTEIISINENIQNMRNNIFKAIFIIQNLEDRISIQEKYEELEEILSN
ncbi:ABC transporter permease [Pseudomonas syringae pv. broussonetiae]|nr:ABC transporter permease [Pseudomonas syringae pv. broussonetiae]KWT09444.1 hypothetical protein AL047_16370 [Pseudomonas syringae pv. broussonetiae]